MKAVGIDIGTTSISAVVMDAHTRAVVCSRTISSPGFVDTAYAWERIQCPERILEAAWQLLDEMLSCAEDIAVIGLTGQMHGIVYLDEEGKAVSPLFTWQDGRGNLKGPDGRSVCERVSGDFGVGAFSGYGMITHLYHLQEGMVPEEAASVATIADYFAMALTGAKAPILHSSNAASLGLYDIQRHAWRTDILRAFGGDDAIFPQTVQEFEIVGCYRGMPVAVAVGDNQASFLGAVRCADEQVLLNMGTGGQVSLLADGILQAEEIEMRPFCGAGYLAVGASLCGGRAYAALAGFMASCARAFGCEPQNVYAVLEEMAERVEGENDGMIVDTRFEGTRAQPQRRGGIANITTENFTPEGLVRGVLEGMVRELHDDYLAMESGLGVRRSRIVASGNGMRKNRALQRAAANMFGMELELSAQEEEAACGACLAGLIAIGERTWQEAVGFTRGNNAAR
ncbi:MAG: hypothetical protein IKU73_06045 [Clostridia bacterium]|nr:hypothetical protein [Clostridia bacterium]